MSGRGRIASGAAAVALIVLFVAGLAITSYLEMLTGVREVTSGEQILLLTAFVWFALLGALLVWRQPRNPMGWILAAIALLITLGPPGPAYVDFVLRDGGEASTALAMLAWPNNWYWIALLALVFIFVPLLFPDGRLPSRRWRPVAWLAGASTTAICVLGALAETITTQGARLEIVNPIGIAGLAHPEHSAVGAVLLVGFLIGVVGAFVSVVVRFRRARDQERLQIKWLLFASALVILSVPTEALQDGQLAWVNTVVTGFAFNALPLAIGVAILRYRLYAIDRIVSRTLTYAAVIAVLGAAYAVAVILLGQVLAPFGAGSDLAVAAATLLAAALFRPVLGRVRSGVDRRFDRARYDAARTVEAFAQRLRDEVDLDDLTRDLREVTARTLRPGSVGLLLTGRGVRR